MIVTPILEKKNLPTAFRGYSVWRKAEKFWGALGSSILPPVPVGGGAGCPGRDPRGWATADTQDRLVAGRKQVSMQVEEKE